MADRFNLNSQLEHLQMKYVGTGHADISKYEWLVNQQRDSMASYIGHPNMLSYFSVVENESRGRKCYNLLEHMVQPCGPIRNSTHTVRDVDDFQDIKNGPME